MVAPVRQNRLPAIVPRYRVRHEDVTPWWCGVLLGLVIAGSGAAMGFVLGAAACAGWRFVDWVL